MLSAFWNELGTASRILLIGCLAVIPIAAGILLIDRLFIREPPLPPEELLPPVAERLGLNLEFDSPQRGFLLALLQRFEPIVGEARSVETVMWREDVSHRLWVFEFKASEVVMITDSHLAPLKRHRANITRLAIAVELKGANLPEWTVLSKDALPAPPWTVEAAERASRIEDLWLGTSGAFVIAVARPDRFALGEMVARNISPEFHPGLANSALAIDVQRVLDVVNRMDTGGAQLARVYRIDGIEVKLPEVRRPDFSGIYPRPTVAEGEAPRSIDALSAEFDSKMAEVERAAAARQAESDARFEAERAQSEARSQAFLEQIQRDSAEADARRQADHEAMRARLEQLREQRRNSPSADPDGDPR